MFSRRRLIASIIGSGIAGLGGLATWRFTQSSDVDGIAAVLCKRLDYLMLDEDGVRTFADDLAARDIVSTSKLRWIEFAGPVYTRLVPAQGNALTRELNHGEERIVSLYLLSSDFFVNGADETKLVRYLGFYDPLGQINACGNPFSRPLTF